MSKKSSLKFRNKIWLIISWPYLWLLVFFLAPFLIIVKISFSSFAEKIPPYTDLVTYVEGMLSINLDLSNYLFIFEDSLYWSSYLSSIRIAAIATFITLLISYPLAYFIARMSNPFRNICMLLVILPSWTSFLIRIYAWIGILKEEGLLNHFLIWLNVISDPLKIMYSETAVYIGIVYSYLPFMVFPLYVAIVKMDMSVVEAGFDLGARPVANFFRVILPLSAQGIISGSMLVFIPSLGEFIVPDLLGASETKMIGRVMWTEFFNNRDWPLASALTVIMMMMLILPLMLFNNAQNKEVGK